MRQAYESSGVQDWVYPQQRRSCRQEADHRAARFQAAAVQLTLNENECVLQSPAAHQWLTEPDYIPRWRVSAYFGVIPNPGRQLDWEAHSVRQKILSETGGPGKNGVGFR